MSTMRGLPAAALTLLLPLLLLLDPAFSFTSPQRHIRLPTSPSITPSQQQQQNDGLLQHHQPYFRSHHSKDFLLLADNNKKESYHPKHMNFISKGIAKFRARPGTYLVMPIVAALVGYITNWMAVQMIFYPIKFRGIPIYIKPEVPLGLLGWQGIVPCKTRKMSETMVTLVTEQLLSVKEVFGRLSPSKIANLLAPRVPMVAQEILTDLPLPGIAKGLPAAVYNGLDAQQQSIVQLYNVEFLQNLVKDLQKNIVGVFDIQQCVQMQMLKDRTLLGKLFQKCGSQELKFLTNSGLWFGFLLGIIQMLVSLFIWESKWSPSLGGTVVGYATNWLALKWIFEPVHPTKVGPFILQGQFLRRQPEVAKEFSAFFANRILNAQELWKSMLAEPKFQTLFGVHFGAFMRKTSRGLFSYTPEPETVAFATQQALEKLPNHVPVLYDYMDGALGLEASLRTQMEKMSSEQFEKVLHPIFEEDELTLVLAGAFLGFAAGLIQQGFETGQLSMTPVTEFFAKWYQTTKDCARGVSRDVWRRIKRRRRKPKVQNPKDDEAK